MKSSEFSSLARKMKGAKLARAGTGTRASDLFKKAQTCDSSRIGAVRLGTRASVLLNLKPGTHPGQRARCHEASVSAPAVSKETGEVSGWAAATINGGGENLVAGLVEPGSIEAANRRLGLRARHRRFDPSKPCPTQARASLIEASTASTTARQYVSRMGVLDRWCGARGLPMERLEEQEFFLFLADLRDQRMASAEGYRSALLQHQRKRGALTWAGDKDVILATKAVARNARTRWKRAR